MAANAARAAWASYTRLLGTRPVLTRSVTSAVILSAADYTCQKIEGREEVSLQRVASMGATGAVLVGPAVFKWYSFLGRVFGEGASVRVVGKKLVADQLVFAPVMFAAIMTSANLLNGKSPEQAREKLETELWGAVKRGWCVWSVATSVNFAFCPPQFRVLFNNTVSFGWNIFLSNVNNRRLALPAEAEAAAAVETPKLVPKALAQSEESPAVSVVSSVRN